VRRCSAGAETDDYLYWSPRARLRPGGRFGDWKGVRIGFEAPLQLYDLKKDLGGTTDVAGQNAGIVRRSRS